MPDLDLVAIAKLVEEAKYDVPIHFLRTIVRSYVPALIAEVARLTAERDAWIETARQHSANEDYYRGLVQKCGEVFGEAARTQDDGGIVEDVLCAKVPELVERLRHAMIDALGVLEEVADAR